MATKTKAPISTGTCEWCSTPLVAGAATCANCNATAVGKTEIDIPGLTSLPIELQIADARISDHVAALNTKRIVQILVPR